MHVLDRSITQKVVISSMVAGWFAALVVLVGMLIAQSTKLSAVTINTTQVGNLGPIRLFALNKTPISGGGYQASIQFFSGLYGYAGIWIIFVAGVIAIRLLRAQRLKTT